MADVTTTRTAPAEFIEARGKTFLDLLEKSVGDFRKADLSKAYGQQFVAQMDPLTLQAADVAARGPTAYKDYMSPFQQDVIDATLEDFDIQAQKGIGSFRDAAVQAGAFGGARQGIAEAEFKSASDRNRAALQAQLMQQGFQQANQLMGQDISRLTGLGSLGQQQKQNELLAQQQLAQQKLTQQLKGAEIFGQGVTGLIAGYPGRTVQEIMPSISPLQTALSAGATAAGIYGALR